MEIQANHNNIQIISTIALIFLNHNFFQIKDQNKSQNEEKIEKVCRLSKLRGDGICDDEANVYECDFDGGDCCAPNSIMDFCLQCQCYGNCLISIYS